MQRRFVFTCALSIVIACLASRATAQTPIVAPGAMQPSTGTGILHFMPMYRHESDDPLTGQQSADDYALLTQVAYGLAKNVAIQFDVPMVYSAIKMGAVGGGGSDDEFGLADSTALLKWRIYQNDSAPTETMRFSLIGGVQIPGSVDGWDWDSSDGWDPIFGAVFSTVRGRHGFNADVLWEFYTGSDRDIGKGDSLRADVSYLFRISPAQYSAETTGALYAVAELNAYYDTNGDTALFFSPGIMYEARSFTLDATVMIPIYQQVDYRAEIDIAVGIGLRISF